MRYINLTQKKKAIVDDEYYKVVSKYKWHYVDAYTPRKNGYARRQLRQGGKAIGYVRMHHLILPFKKGYMVDHINGNGLDNRRKNLRLVTKSQNMMNSGVRVNNVSGYKGVSWVSREKKWRVTIWKENKQFDIGRFEDKVEAVKAYNQAAKMYHGEYAKLNIL